MDVLQEKLKEMLSKVEEFSTLRKEVFSQVRTKIHTIEDDEQKKYFQNISNEIEEAEKNNDTNKLNEIAEELKAFNSAL